MSSGKYDSLQKELSDFVAAQDACIGIGIIIGGKDTVAVNGHRMYPMLSVYKFPISLALADSYHSANLTFDHMIRFPWEDLHTDTYSPMTERLLSDSLSKATPLIPMTTRELLAYSLRESDNNASDIILREAGGAGYVQLFLDRTGISGIHVRHSEMEMHNDNSLCFSNSSTPLAMASLIDIFDREYVDSLSMEIKQIMESCTTGTGRLPKPLLSRNAVIGHKTGTGFTLPDGRLMAVNDAGYVHLPDGRHYSIAVFVENSGGDISQTEAMIASISEIAFRHISRHTVD